MYLHTCGDERLCQALGWCYLLWLFLLNKLISSNIVKKIELTGNPVAYLYTDKDGKETLPKIFPVKWNSSKNNLSPHSCLDATRCNVPCRIFNNYYSTTVHSQCSGFSQVANNARGGVKWGPRGQANLVSRGADCRLPKIWYAVWEAKCCIWALDELAYAFLIRGSTYFLNQ